MVKERREIVRDIKKSPWKAKEIFVYLVSRGMR
jgi:hypothetical protein